MSMTLVSTAGEIPGPGLGPIWPSIWALELTPAGPGSSQVSMTLVSTAGDIPGPGLGPIWPSIWALYGFPVTRTETDLQLDSVPTICAHPCFGCCSVGGSK